MSAQSHGGIARARSLSSLRRSEIAKQAAEARWERQIEMVAPKREPYYWMTHYHPPLDGGVYGNASGLSKRALMEDEDLIRHFVPGIRPNLRLRIYLKPQDPTP